MEFHRVRLGDAVVLSPGQRFQVPFDLFVPWETPITVTAAVSCTP